MTDGIPLSILTNLQCPKFPNGRYFIYLVAWWGHLGGVGTTRPKDRGWNCWCFQLNSSNKMPDKIALSVLI